MAGISKVKIGSTTYDIIQSHNATVGGGSIAASVGTSESQVMNFSGSTRYSYFITMTFNTYSTGSHAADVYIKYNGGTYGGSTNVTSATPNATTKIAQMQLSTNSRHATKTISFFAVPGAQITVYIKATTTLYYTCFYTAQIIDDSSSS